VSEIAVSADFFEIRSDPHYYKLDMGCGIHRGRPYVRLWDDLCTIYVLQDPMHQWLEDRDVFYGMDIDLISGNSHVDIPDQRAAMLFKLTWYGVIDAA